jgi:hypothetical protein
MGFNVKPGKIDVCEKNKFLLLAKFLNVQFFEHINLMFEKVLV